MTSLMRRVLEHTGKTFSKAGDLAFYLKKETVLRTFEPPVAADLILAISVEGDDQFPEQLASEAKVGTTRAKLGTFAGRIDHGEKTVKMEIRVPAALAGTSTIMGDAVLEALFGYRRVVNTQTKVAITSVTTHARTGTKVRVVAAEEDFRLGDVVALRSRNAQTAGMADQPACIALVEFPGGGNLDLTLRPALTQRPYTTGGTPDQLQGGVTWKPLEDWVPTWSALWTQGYEGDAAEGCVVPSGTFSFDGRSILTMDFPLHFRKSYYSAIGFVKGTAGTDAFATTTTVLDVYDASIFKPGAYVNLLKFTVATGALAGTEVQARVTAVNTTASPNTVTLTRGTSPVAQTGGTQDLQATTAVGDADDLVATVTISAGDFLRIEVDRRGYIDVPLTAGAGKDATDIVADINAALLYSPLYGQATDAPFVAVDWSTCATESTAGGTSKVLIASKSYGSQSQVKAINTGLAGDRFTTVWTSAVTFEITAEAEVQLIPWTPGGAETRLPVINKNNYCRVDGYQLLVTQATVVYDNQVEHLEDVKTGDDYEAGHLSGRERAVSAAITIPDWGWTARLRKMAEASQGLFLGLISGSGEGSTFSVYITKGVPGGVSKSGDNRQDKAFTCMGEDPAVSVTTTGGVVYRLPDCVAGLT